MYSALHISGIDDAQLCTHDAKTSIQPQSGRYADVPPSNPPPPV